MLAHAPRSRSAGTSSPARGGGSPAPRMTRGPRVTTRQRHVPRDFVARVSATVSVARLAMCTKSSFQRVYLRRTRYAHATSTESGVLLPAAEGRVARSDGPGGARFDGLCILVKRNHEAQTVAKCRGHGLHFRACFPPGHRGRRQCHGWYDRAQAARELERRRTKFNLVPAIVAQVAAKHLCAPRRESDSGLRHRDAA